MMLKLVPDTWQAEVLFFFLKEILRNNIKLVSSNKFAIKCPVPYSFGIMNFNTFSILSVISLI
jgi:hypothetical protein